MADLLAAYSFDEASGDVVDRSGNGHDFSLGANGTRAAGHTNTAATKSGGGGTLVPLPAGLLAAVNASASRTLMCWLKGTGATWYVRCQHNDISSGGWGVLNLTGTQIGPRARNAAGLAQFQTAIPGGGADWYHLAASYSDADDTLRTFINGVLVDSRTLASPLRSDADSLDIMEWSESSTLLDDLRFFDGAIVDEAEIAALAATPVEATPGVEQPIGPAAEVDTAQPLGRSKALAADAAAETDAAQPFGATKARALGTAATVETAQPFGRHKSLALGTAFEVDTAQGLFRGKARALGTAAEIDAAGALGATKTRALGTAVERDTAVAFVQEPVVTPTVGGNGLQVEEITARCVSFVAGLGVVEDVNGGDIRHMINGGLRAGIFVSDLTTIRSSGLDAVSVRLEQTIRLYERLQVEPSDVLDIETLKAVDAICNAFVENFEIDGIVRQVDVLGAHGQPLRARPGFLTVQEQECRIADVIVPLICDDVWIYE